MLRPGDVVRVDRSLATYVGDAGLALWSRPLIERDEYVDRCQTSSTANDHPLLIVAVLIASRWRGGCQVLATGRDGRCGWLNGNVLEPLC